MKRVVAPAATSPEKLLAHFHVTGCILDVSSILGSNISIPRIFMDRGNFLIELDLWGSAEVQLIISAGVW